MKYLPQFGDNTQDVSGMPVDDSLMNLQLKRRMAFADALREQQMPQGQMIGDRYVAPSWTQQLANAVGKMTGAYQEKKALDQYKDFAKTKQEKQADALKALSGAIAPTAVTENSTYDIQVPNGRTPQTENLGGMQPYESGMKNISVPVTNTTGQRNRTSSELLQAVADYAAATKDPAMYEKLVMGQVSKSLEPKQTDWKALEGKLYGFDMQGNPTGKTLGEGKKETPGTLQKDFEYAKSQGYKGSVEDYKRISSSWINPYQGAQLSQQQRELDIKEDANNPLGMPKNKPKVNQPLNKSFKLDDGQSTMGTWDPTIGKYTVKRGNKTYVIEE